MIIMPSTPRLSTPARSTTSSPAAASSSGVEAASTARTMASTKPMGGLAVGRDQTEAVQDQGIAAEHKEQKNALKNLGQVERHLDGNLRLLAADESERQEKAGNQYADRIQPSEECDDDRREPIAWRNPRLQMADRPRDFDDAGEAGERTRHDEGEQNELRRVEPRETGRLGGRARARAPDSQAGGRRRRPASGW